MLLTVVIACRDSTVASGDNRKTGLSPAFTLFANSSTGAAITPQPAITEIGEGQYRFQYDPETAEITYQIDFGNTLSNGNDRYIDGVVLRDSSRIQAAIASGGALAAAVQVGSYAAGEAPDALVWSKVLETGGTANITTAGALQALAAILAGALNATGDTFGPIGGGAGTRVAYSINQDTGARTIALTLTE